jgi:hypothetical protein
LLLYLMFAPTGATLSLDRLIARYRESRRALADGRLPELKVAPSWSANVVMRLIQLHMCVIYFAAGTAKLQGGMWWGGTAAWYTMMVPELELVDMRWLALLPEWIYLFIVTFSTYFTVLYEIGFPFLIWNRTLRPLMILGAIGLHAGIGFFMGLGGFGIAMITGCFSFIPPESFRWLIEYVGRGKSGYRFVYDASDVRHVRAAGWLHAADPYGQVALLESRDKSAPAGAGSLVTPDGRILTGAEAFLGLLSVLRSLWVATPIVFWAFVGLPVTRAEPAARS